MLRQERRRDPDPDNVPEVPGCAIAFTDIAKAQHPAWVAGMGLALETAIGAAAFHDRLVSAWPT